MIKLTEHETIQLIDKDIKNYWDSQFQWTKDIEEYYNKDCPNIPKVSTERFEGHSGSALQKFYCGFCNKEHIHGVGYGHRGAHCSSISPFNSTGYILCPKGTKKSIFFDKDFSIWEEV